MTNNVAKLIESQIGKELTSAYLYLDFSNYFAANGLNGFANWYKVQAQEEVEHAMRFIDYLQSSGEVFSLGAIQKPADVLMDMYETDYDEEDLTEGILEILKAGLNHEIYITASIDNIYDQAMQSKDFRTMEFLNWFIEEQAEEEKNASEMISNFMLFGEGCGAGLMGLDERLGKRE